MSPEAQRIAIEEVCPAIKSRVIYYAADAPINPPITEWRCNGVVCLNNDPLQDLNAMHEVEKVLTIEQRINYRWKLHEIVGKDGWKYTNATAAQRAEASLRTLNVWDDTK